jgi:hypothetical protein
MHVKKFYPWTMSRSWAVWDGQAKPHSLWIFRSDAEEMAARLATLDPEPRRSRPLPLSPQEDQR